MLLYSTGIGQIEATSCTIFNALLLAGLSPSDTQNPSLLARRFRPHHDVRHHAFYYQPSRGGEDPAPPLLKSSLRGLIEGSEVKDRNL